MDFNALGDDLICLSGFLATQGGRADSPEPRRPPTPTDDSPRRPAVGFDSYVDRYSRPDVTSGKTYRAPTPDEPDYDSDSTNHVGYRFVDNMSLYQTIRMAYRQWLGGMGKPDQVREPLRRLSAYRRRIESELSNGKKLDGMEVAQEVRPIANECFLAGGDAWYEFKDFIGYLERRRGVKFPTEAEILAQPRRH